jgi:hypothetical protein
MKKKTTAPPAKKQGKPKAAPPKKKKPAPKPSAAVGGSVSSTTQTSTVNRRTTIDPGATVLLSDAQYSAEVIAALKDAFGPAAIVAEFRTLLSATLENKHGDQMVDHRTRLAALEKIVHLVVGKPIDRIQNIETTVWSYEEIEELVKHSPMLRNALRGILAPYDEEDNGK